MRHSADRRDYKNSSHVYKSRHRRYLTPQYNLAQDITGYLYLKRGQIYPLQNEQGVRNGLPVRCSSTDFALRYATNIVDEVKQLREK